MHTTMTFPMVRSSFYFFLVLSRSLLHSCFFLIAQLFHQSFTYVVGGRVRIHATLLTLRATLLTPPHYNTHSDGDNTSIALRLEAEARL